MHFEFFSQTYHRSLLQQKMSTSDCNFSGSVRQKFPWQKYSISYCHHSVESWKKYSMLFCPLMKYCFSLKYKTGGHLSKILCREIYFSEDMGLTIHLHLRFKLNTKFRTWYILGLVGHLDSLLLFSRLKLFWPFWRYDHKKNMEGVYYVLDCYGSLFSNFDPELDHENCFGQEDINKCDTSRDF